MDLKVWRNACFHKELEGQTFSSSHFFLFSLSLFTSFIYFLPPWFVHDLKMSILAKGAADPHAAGIMHVDAWCLKCRQYTLQGWVHVIQILLIISTNMLWNGPLTLAGHLHCSPIATQWGQCCHTAITVQSCCCHNTRWRSAAGLPYSLLWDAQIPSLPRMYGVAPYGRKLCAMLVSWHCPSVPTARRQSPLSRDQLRLP